MPEFNGLGLLIVGLCSFVVVLAFAVHMGINAWKLIRRSIRISRVALPLAEGLGRRSEELASMGYRLGLEVDKIALNLEALDASVRRLTLLIEAFRDAMRPYRKVRDYLGF